MRLITSEIRTYDKVLGIHDLMVHDYGPGRRFASVHVEMDSHEDPLVCHDIIDDIERDFLQKHRIHLVIHSMTSAWSAVPDIPTWSLTW